MVQLYPEILLKGTNEEVLYVLVPAAEWIVSNLPAIGDKFSTCSWIVRNGADRYEDFVLLSYDHVRTQEGAFQRLIFGRDYTTTNPATGLPYSKTPVLTYTKSKGNHEWLPELRRLEFKPDFNLPVGVTATTQDGSPAIYSAPRLLPDYDLKAASHEGTHFVLKIYLSNTPHQIGRSPSPQPNSVNVHFGTASFQVAEVLHDDLEVSDQLSAQTLYNASTQTGSVTGGSVGGKRFPATNFRRARPYIISEDQDNQNWLYFRYQLWGFPPRGRRTQRETQ